MGDSLVVNCYVICYLVESCLISNHTKSPYFYMYDVNVMSFFVNFFYGLKSWTVLKLILFNLFTHGLPVLINSEIGNLKKIVIILGCLPYYCFIGECNSVNTYLFRLMKDGAKKNTNLNDSNWFSSTFMFYINKDLLSLHLHTPLTTNA